MSTTREIKINKKNAHQKEVVDFWEDSENLTLTAPNEDKKDGAKQRVFVNELRGTVKTSSST